MIRTPQRAFLPGRRKPPPMIAPLRTTGMLVLVLALLGGCTGAPREAQHFASPARRVVSLIPSLTEDLCAIGAGRALVGVSQASSGIACARGIPRVGNFASIDAERIVTLRPDLVVGIPAQARVTRSLRNAGVTTALLPDDTYGDIFADIRALGALTGRQKQAARLQASLIAETARLVRSEHFRYRPSVFVVLGSGPIWTVGPQSFISRLIYLSGGRNAVTKLRVAYAQYSPEALLLLQPDVIVTDTSVHLEAVLGREPWRSLRAVQDGRVFVLPLTAADALERPGPHYPQGVAWLIDRLRPIAR